MATETSGWDTSSKFPEMTVVQKVSFLFKLVIMLCTFGFVFPNLMD